MGVLIGLDIGTGGARALAVESETGELRAEASAEHELLMPKAGWSEQRPADWWAASRAVLTEVARETGGDVIGLGLTGQMHGSVFLDDADEVIRPALLWNDQRTGRQCEQIDELIGREELLALAGNPALTGFQAPKILWLRDEEPESYRRVASVLLPKDYIRLQLTGDKATDAADASGTLLFGATAAMVQGDPRATRARRRVDAARARGHGGHRDPARRRGGRSRPATRLGGRGGRR